MKPNAVPLLCTRVRSKKPGNDRHAFVERDCDVGRVAFTA